MVYLYEMAEDSFILVQAEWTAGQTRQLIEDEHLKKATHVIVHRVGPFGEFYYLYTRAEALDRLVDAGDEISVERAFDLHEWRATDVADAYADGETAPDRVVIVDDGDLVGFYDVRVPPSKELAGSKRGDEPVPRSLIAEFPEKVPLEKTVSLLVQLSAEMEQALEALPSLPTSVPRGAVVDVIVQAKRRFEIVGTSEGSISVADENETLPLQFKLKATEEGEGRIRILAFQEGQPLGAIILTPQVVGDTEEVSETPVGFDQDMLPISIHQPDLSLLILESTDKGHMALTLRLTAKEPSLGLEFKPYGPVRFEMSPADYFASFFKDIDNLQVNTPEKRAMAEAQLSAKGLELFDTLIPKDLQVLLWSLKHRIKTVQILSEEPWIPWELCRLQCEEKEGWIEGDFLCEAFSVTRWLPGQRLKPPPPTLTLNKIGLVVPTKSRLLYAPAEKAHLLNLAGDGRGVEDITPRFLPLTSALASGQYDGWHFTGHGSFRGETPNRSEIELDEHEKLTPELLNGRIRNLGQAHPLVFMNACEIGQGAMSLTGIGGWSTKFLQAGAAAFIGAYWSVFDQPALDFAKALYKGLLDDNLPIGEAVHAARLAIKKEGEPTRLAYTVFADPLATVQAPKKEE